MSRYLVLIVAFSLLLGCGRGKGKHASTQQESAPAPAPTQQPLAPGVSVELSNPKFDVFGGFHMRFDYRFIKGKPDPEKWYLFHADIQDKDKKTIQVAGVEVLGKDLQQQGTISKNGTLFQSNAAMFFSVKLYISTQKNHARLEDVISSKDLQGRIER